MYYFENELLIKQLVVSSVYYEMSYFILCVFLCVHITAWTELPFCAMLVICMYMQDI